MLALGALVVTIIALLVVTVLLVRCHNSKGEDNYTTVSPPTKPWYDALTKYGRYYSSRCTFVLDSPADNIANSPTIPVGQKLEITNTGSLTTNGQMINNGGLTNNGQMINNGWLRNNGQMINNGSFTNLNNLYNYNQLINTSTFDNQYVIYNAGSGSLLRNTGTFNNKKGEVFNTGTITCNPEQGCTANPGTWIDPAPNGGDFTACGGQ